MKFFSSDFDFENFIAITIPIENRFRINRTLIERSTLWKRSAFQNAPRACEASGAWNGSLREWRKLRQSQSCIPRERGTIPVRDRKTLFASDPI
jgi:hypothetical protein